MNITVKNNIVEALKTFMKEHKISGNEFAKKANVNSSYISHLLNGDYTYDAGNGKTGDIADSHFKKIAEYIDYELEKVYWETVPTAQLKNTIAILQDAQNYSYTNVIIGETGCGKSYAAQLFAKKNPKDFILVTVGQSDNLNDLLNKIIDKLNVNEIPRSKSGKLSLISKRMREMKLDGLNPVLCFDEAEYMKQPALCAMKELYDNLTGYCAIQMIGTDQLLRKIEKMKKANKDGIPQLYRRIKFGIRMLPTIDRTFKQFLNGIEKSLATFLQENCDNYGELHDVLVPAMREADRTGEPLTENFVRMILGMPTKSIRN